MAHESEKITNDELTALFAQLVVQQTNLAMMLLGKVAHPDSGQVTRDLDAARLFIDQLQMLETKTKGNLTTQESSLLAQSLMSLRLAFVQAVDEREPSKTSAPQPSPAAPANSEPAADASAGDKEAEHRPKFSKKY